MPAASPEMIYDQPVDSDTLGSRILRAREASSMTKEALARSLGIKRSTLESWERDRSEPRAHHLMRMSGMLGVSPSWMLGGIGQAPATETIADEVRIIRGQLQQLKDVRDQATLAIANIEKTLERLLELAEDAEAGA